MTKSSKSYSNPKFTQIQQQQQFKYMGNNPPQKAYQDFTASCHPQLRAFTFDPQQHLLFTLVKMEESLLVWRRSIDPLFQKPHLFLPFKITAHDFITDLGCCTHEDFHRPDLEIKKIYYEPFIYTLENQIRSRKSKLARFRQQQMWKMLGYLSKAILEWKSVYPAQKIGGIYPQNVIMNTSGQMKLVCRLSFFDYSYNEQGNIYSLQGSNKNSSTVYQYQQDYNRIQSSEVYSIGVVLLEAATLQIYGISQLSVTQKKDLLIKQNIFSPDLIDLILKMINQNPLGRPKAIELVHQSKINKNKRL